LIGWKDNVNVKKKSLLVYEGADPLFVNKVLHVEESEDILFLFSIQ
jgi:hypothetical protein